MTINKPTKASTGQLPKSVKVRSTCNACQQAKIRCSHEKPSCRRCQKHKIDCMYSVSRRLGRPAKKKESQGIDQVDVDSTQIMLEQDGEKKSRKTSKKRCRTQHANNTSRTYTSRPPDDLPVGEQNMAKSTVEDDAGGLSFRLYICPT